MIFPAAAALAWAVFAYVCIDFGFWRKMFGLGDASERIWRAGVEATIGATLIIFLFAYLNLRRWHVRYTHFAFAWLVLMGGRGRALGLQSGDRRGRGEDLHRHRRRHWIPAHPEPRGARVRPRRDADPDLVSARGLGGGRGRGGARLSDQ